MRRLSLLTVLLCLLLGTAARAAGPVGSAAPGCANDSDTEVCFNDATSADVQQRGVIFTRIRQEIDLAGPGDEVRMSMFSWTSAGDGIARALVRAKGKGADVAVITGNGMTGPIRSILQAGGVPLKECQVACISQAKGSINHTKLVLLRLQGRKETIVTSSNLTGKQQQLYNSSVRTVADDGLYDFYRAYWDRLQAGSWLGWGDPQKVTLTPAGTAAVVFPRSDVDPIAQALRSVKACPKGHNRIWGAIAIYTAQRKAIQTQLRRLSRMRGCDVRLVIGNAVDAGFASKGLKPGKVKRAPVHHKLLVLDANVGGQVRQVVYTGSHNWSGSALRANDELLTAYTQPVVVATFLLRYADLFKNRAR